MASSSFVAFEPCVVDKATSAWVGVAYSSQETLIVEQHEQLSHQAEPSHVVDGCCVQLRTRPVRRIDRGGDVDFAVVFAISNDRSGRGLFR
eukprot:EC850968.1.p2 GENE.EC850968.1~~EC850968.1.p2  ORF type:complete len:91 (-),score=13.92 EC850968.1:294-566(-)